MIEYYLKLENECNDVIKINEYNEYNEYDVEKLCVTLVMIRHGW